MAAMEELVGQLEEGIGYSWTGLSYQERQAGAQTLLLYSLSILVVFLSLAALYESWGLPASVIMVIPLGVVGALAAVTLRGFNNDIYFQVEGRARWNRVRSPLLRAGQGRPPGRGGGARSWRSPPSRGGLLP